MRAHLKIIPVTYPVSHHGDILPPIISGCDAALKYYPVHGAVACPYRGSTLATTTRFRIVAGRGCSVIRPEPVKSDLYLRVGS